MKRKTQPEKTQKKPYSVVHFMKCSYLGLTESDYKALAEKNRKRLNAKQ